MLKQFSAYNPHIADCIHDVDNVSFAWSRRKAGQGLFAFPLVGKIDGSLFRLSDFGSDYSFFIQLSLPSFEDALKVSIDSYGGMNLLSPLEWINIYHILHKYNIAPCSFIPEFLQGRDGKSFYCMLEKMASWSTAIISYFEIKTPSWKTVGLMSLMDRLQINYISDYLMNRQPSVQEFRKFVETVIDFKDNIPDEPYNEDKFISITDRRSIPHKELNSLLISLSEKIEPASVFNKDQFESNTLSFNFTVNSCDEYRKIVSRINESQAIVENIFKIIGVKK